jgi:hypothetical protein
MYSGTVSGNITFGSPPSGTIVSEHYGWCGHSASYVFQVGQLTLKLCEECRQSITNPTSILGVKDNA